MVICSLTVLLLHDVGLQRSLASKDSSILTLEFESHASFKKVVLQCTTAFA